MLPIGSELTDTDGRRWVVCRWNEKGQQVAYLIPDGETVMGMGRTWKRDDQPVMIIPPEKGTVQ
jgi:hypothetical protein